MFYRSDSSFPVGSEIYCSLRRIERSPATEFAKGFGRYKEEAQREPIAITGYGRVSGYFIALLEEK